MKRFLIALLLSAATTVAALEVPPAPTQWVNDRAGILGGTEEDLLNTKLRNFEQTSGAQFIIYTLPSVEGDSIEDFTMRSVEQWKVGQKKYDNGLVLFVFAQDRKVRVEVGYGLEGTITDAFSSRIIRDMIGPPFRQGDYAGGLNAAADAIIKKISTGEEPVPPLQPGGAQQQQPEQDIPLPVIIFFLFILFFVILPMMRRRGCSGCIFPFFFPGGGITFGGGGGGGFSSGGFGGGGGGFSGGGGSFGGGGATGGW